MKKYVMAGLAALASASSANAATLIPSYTVTSALPSYTTAVIFEDFSQIVASSSGTAYTGGAQKNASSPYAETASNTAVFNSTQSGQAVDPLNASGNYLAVKGGGSFAVNLGSVGVQFFSFVFGSLDPYNTLVLTYSDGTSQTFNGAAIANNAVPANGQNSSGGRVNFDAAGGAGITSATFTSSFNSFEIDSLAAAAPEPGTWALMILGFGLVGSQLRSRRRSGAFVAA